MELYTYEWTYPVDIGALSVTARPGDTLEQIGPDQYKLFLSQGGRKLSLNWPDSMCTKLVAKGYLKVTGTKGKNEGGRFEDNLPVVVHADQLDDTGNPVVEQGRKQTSFEVIKTLTPKDANVKKTTSEVVMVIPKKGEETDRKRQSQEVVLKINKGGKDAAKIQGHSEVVKIPERTAKAEAPAITPKPPVKVATPEVPAVHKSRPSMIDASLDGLSEAAGEAAVVGKLVKRVSRKAKA